MLKTLINGMLVCQEEGGEVAAATPEPSAPAAMELGLTLDATGEAPVVDPESGETATQEPSFLAYPESEEQMAAYRSQMGIGDSPDDYALTVDEGFELAEDVTQFLKTSGHKHGIPPKAMNAFVQDWMAREHEQSEQGRKQLEEGFAKLRREQGPKYDAYVSAAERAFVAIANSAGVDVQALSESGFTRNPEVFKLFNAVSQFLDEKGAKGVGQQQATSGEQDAHRMESDPSHPLYAAYYDPQHPKHRYAHEVYDRALGLR